MKQFLILSIFLAVVSNRGIAQNETQRWYFGSHAGLDFSTSPPTILTGGALVTNEGCAGICDGNGALLFYTDGVTVYDKTHNTMANGGGLNGNTASSQSALIVKQPGNSNIYFVFTLGAGGTGSLCVSTVDMSLAAGLGSVTVKNTVLLPNMTEKITAVKHCNGRDTWVVTHENSSANFKTFLVDPLGVSATPVVSGLGPSYPLGTSYDGTMKASPNGKKLGLARSGTSGAFELYDFDDATGMVSNLVNLGNFSYAYGCEFSPDGSKLYGSIESGANSLTLYQWDLCAGNNAAIVASQFTLSLPSQIMGMQLAKDGKIYVAKYNQPELAIIQNPDLAGSACNYLHIGQSIAPNICHASLPNFVTSYLKPPPPYTLSVNCSTVTFLAPGPSTVNAGCNAIAVTPTNVLWTFGDPTSGAANTSTLINPSHSYATNGNYSVQLVLYTSCGSDTVKYLTNITTAVNPSVTGNFTTCPGTKNSYTASGASTYTWSSGPSSPIAALSPTSTSVYTLTGTAANFCLGSKIFTVYVDPCTALDPAENSELRAALYPNPSRGNLCIELQEAAQVQVYDTLGSLLFATVAEKGKLALDLQEFPDGIYLVKLGNSKSAKTIRLVKTE